MAETVWLDRAHAEVDRAHRDLEADDADAVLQHACQALECALKAIIISEGQDPRADTPRDEYSALQAQANAHLSAHAEVIEELTGVWSRSTAPDTPNPDIMDMDRLLADVEGVVDYAETYVTP